MKTLDTIKEFHPKINSMLVEIDDEIKDKIKKMKKEMNNTITEERINLLKIICDGEGLNFNDLKGKYLSNKDLKLVIDTPPNHSFNEELLDTIEIKGIKYFYENKENGKIFEESSSKHVGFFKNSQYILNIN